MPLKPGQTVSHYRLVEMIGEGGMGQVWRATDTDLGRDVALKVLPDEVAGNDQRLARFRSEARTVAALNHPNIVTIHSVETDRDLHFLTMELVEGETLERRLSVGRPSLRELMDVVVPLADAVGAAHRQGVTHRDLKPGNVMLTADGRVKVLDFGLAKVRGEAGLEDSSAPTRAVTRAGEVLGTIPYSSPEQLKGGTVDLRSDIFSLGIVLHEMATGARPFTGDSPAEVLSSVLRDTPPPVHELCPELPRQLSRIVSHCLEKDPGRRFQTAIDLRNELEGLAGEIAASASTAPSTATVTRAGAAAPTAATGAGAAAETAAGRSVDTSTTELEERLRRMEKTLASGSRAGDEAPPRTPRSTLLMVVLAILLGGSSALFLWSRWAREETPRQSPKTVSRSADRTDVAAVPGETIAIAVLPLRNTSGDVEQEYFADGMTDALISSLARIGSLRVISRTTVMRFKGSDLSLPDIADRLGVDYVVEGSVFRSGDSVRITAQLIEAASDRNVWADSYDRATQDVLSLQDEVARQVGRSVQVTLSPEEERRLNRDRTVDPEAYEIYARARSAWRQRTPESVQEAQRLFLQVTEDMPDWAPGWAGLANAYAVIPSYLPVTWDEVSEQARSAAERAIHLDPDLADGYTALCSNHMSEWNWPQAIRACRRATEINPSNATAHQWLAESLIVSGSKEAGIRSARIAQALDPLTPVTSAVLATAYGSVADHRASYKEARRSIEIESDFPHGYISLFIAAYHLEIWEDVELALRRNAELTLGTQDTDWSPVVDGLRDPDLAEAAVTTLDAALAGQEHVLPWFAAIYVLLDRPQRALDVLEPAVARRDPGAIWIDSMSTFRSLRDEPRYQAVIRQLNLLDTPSSDPRSSRPR